MPLFRSSPPKRPNQQKTRRFESSDQKPPSRPRPNSDRLYLTPAEIEKLIAGARSIGRHRDRDALMLLLMFRHGLRVGELCDLRWADIDFSTGLIYVRRLKGGISTHHTLERDEIKALRKLQRSYGSSPFVFNSEIGSALTEDAIRKMTRRAGKLAGFLFPTHPHQLRHSCGYYLASIGVSPWEVKTYLGHRDLRTTLHYCDLAATITGGYWQKTRN